MFNAYVAAAAGCEQPLQHFMLFLCESRPDEEHRTMLAKAQGQETEALERELCQLKLQQAPREKCSLKKNTPARL